MKTIYQYLNNNSWRVRENANYNYSYSGLQAFISSHAMTRFALKIMPEEASKAHRRGDLHIHNLEGPLIPYCCGHDLLTLLQKGVKSASIKAKPAKHFTTVCDHASNYLFMCQLDSAGAQAFSDFNTLCAPFVYYDHLSYKQIKQDVQRLVYNLNFTCRQAFQTPFSNFSFNVRAPRQYKDMPVVIDGKTLSSTYGEFQDESDLILKAFCEVLLDRDAEGRIFTFPIPTLNVIKDIDWDSEAIQAVLNVTSELGSFYFQNYIGSGLSEDSIRAMCCRLQMDISQLADPRGFWNMEGGTGSLGVVSINMSRLGYLATGFDDLYDRLRKLMDTAATYLLFKEKLINDHPELTPTIRYYGFDTKRYFRTIGLIGLNEMCLNFLGLPLSRSPEFVYQVLKFMREYTLQLQENSGVLWNLEMTPGEGSSYSLACLDKKRYKDIKTLGTEEQPYYSTLLIPPSEEIDLFDRVNIEQELLPLFSGGTIFRIFTGEFKLPVESLLALMKKIVYATKIPYFDLTATFSICTKCGRLDRGSVPKCSICGNEMDIYSRVVGYYRPTKKFNPGKLREFEDRLPSIGGSYEDEL